MTLLKFVCSLTAVFLIDSVARPAGAQTNMAKVGEPGNQIRLQASDSGIRLTQLPLEASKSSWASARSKPLTLVDEAVIDGRRSKLHWKFDGDSKTANNITFSFSCPERLQARSVWTSSPKGTFEHTLEIINGNFRSVVLGRQCSFVWSFPTLVTRPLEHWWIEKGAGRPSLVGVHRAQIEPGFAKRLLSQPYMSDKRAYTEDGNDRDPIPWVCIYDPQKQNGWYAGVEFSGRTSLVVNRIKNMVEVELGLASEDSGKPEFTTKLAPKERYVLPTVFFGGFAGSVEDGGNKLKRWINTTLRPRNTDPRYPLLTLNSWGSGMAIDAPLGQSMMRDAAKLGLELFHVDAGWFRGVGDWRSNPAKFPLGINKLSESARRLGLKFGLWTGWTQGGIMPDAEDTQAVLNVHSPTRSGWFTHDYAQDWKPQDFVGADVCLGEQKAVAWSSSLLNRLVGEYKIDMLEHDQRMIVDECQRTDHLHTGAQSDIAYRATLGYYAVYDQLRGRFPNLMFEDCVNGGRMVDFGALKRVDYFSITDSYFPLANRRAFWDASHVIPPAMCECYIMEMPVKSIGEFRSMLRSGMMGWASIMQDPAKWSPAQFTAAQREFILYKKELRPLIKSGDLYHVSERPDGVRWDGIQYLNQSKTKGVLYAFRGTTKENRHTFRLRGLIAGASYRLHFVDGSAADQVFTGNQLMRDGLSLRLTEPENSELVLISKIGASKR